MIFELNKFYRHVDGAVIYVKSYDEKSKQLQAEMPAKDSIHNLEFPIGAESTTWDEISQHDYKMIVVGMQSDDNGTDFCDGPWSHGWENRCNTLAAHKERIEYLEQTLESYEHASKLYGDEFIGWTNDGIKVE